MKKVHSLHVPAMKFIGKKQLVEKVPIILLKYDFCEYVKFGAISWNFDILSITASLQLESKNPFAHMWHI